MPDFSKLKKQRDKKAHAAGEGVWWNVSQNRQAVVKVTFYPRLARWIEEAGERRKIELEELESKYRRVEF